MNPFPSYFHQGILPQQPGKELRKRVPYTGAVYVIYLRHCLWKEYRKNSIWLEKQGLMRHACGSFKTTMLSTAVIDKNISVTGGKLAGAQNSKKGVLRAKPEAPT